LETVQMDELPKCQFCDEEAEYDSKTVFGPLGILMQETSMSVWVSTNNKT